VGGIFVFVGQMVIKYGSALMSVSSGPLNTIFSMRKWSGKWQVNIKATGSAIIEVSLVPTGRNTIMFVPVQSGTIIVAPLKGGKWCDVRQTFRSYMGYNMDPHVNVDGDRTFRKIPLEIILVCGKLCKRRSRKNGKRKRTGSGP